MTITARAVAVFSGTILALVALFGTLADRTGGWAQDFSIASWLPPLVLFPAAALAAAQSDSTSRARDLASTLWPAYAGLALYGVVVGHWWAGWSVALLIMAVHAGVFVLSGTALTIFPATRAAGLHIWLGYLVLLGCWVVGSALF